jgi:hypothetical protein
MQGGQGPPWTVVPRSQSVRKDMRISYTVCDLLHTHVENIYGSACIINVWYGIFFMSATKRCGQVVNTPALYFEGLGFKS